MTGARAATELLTKIIQQAKLPKECLDDFPKKYELVGDEAGLQHVAWEEWNTHQIANQQPSLWQLISECFQRKRIARKAIIKDNELRQSQVQLLYIPPGIISSSSSSSSSASSKPSSKLCRCGHDHTSQPGWVTVLENKISFSFDITRVMFCSGNNTERMRMGKYVLQEKEVIIDFYAGIGYYTVPLLYYHPKMISHLYACEWNPDSVFSLQHNLITANVPDTQYTIIPGDNRIISVANSLINLADRILLGRWQYEH